MLALAARVGSWPRFTASQLARPLAITLVAIGMLAFAAGVFGHVAGLRQWIVVVEPIAREIPEDKHVAFLTDLFAHLASYIGGALGGGVLCVSVLFRRARMARLAAPNYIV
jgi:hypothetical protein